MNAIAKHETLIGFSLQLLALLAAIYEALAVALMWVVGGYVVRWIDVSLLVSGIATIFMLFRLMRWESRSLYLGIATLSAAVWFPALELYITWLTWNDGSVDLQHKHRPSSLDLGLFAVFLIHIPLCVRKLSHSLDLARPLKDIVD